MIFSQAYYASLPDSKLDDSYAIEFDKGTVEGRQNATTAGFVIVDRLQSIGSAIQGAFGGIRFPKYNARGNFQQAQVAQSSLKESAANVGANLSSFADSFGSGLFSAIWPILLLLTIIGLIIYLVKRGGTK